MMEEVNRTAPNLFHTDGLKYWQQRYDVGDTYWLRKEAAAMLVKYYNRLNPDGKANKMLLPLCGKTLDLDWLSSQGVPLVVGVDCLLPVLQEVCSRSEHNWTKKSLHKDGADFTFLERIDGKMKLYSGDMLQFSPEIEGTFDAIWERGALIILPPKDINRNSGAAKVRGSTLTLASGGDGIPLLMPHPIGGAALRRRRYVELLKSLLKPGGRILLESIEFDKDAIDPSVDYTPFPPFPYFSKDIQNFFAPECTVERLDSSPCKWKYGKETDLVIYLITKK